MWLDCDIATVEVPRGKTGRGRLRHDWRECEACGELALVKRSTKPTCRVCGLGKLKRDLSEAERKEGRMKLPKRQEEVTRKDIRAAQLVGRLIAVKLRGLGEGTTKYSEGEIVPHADVAIWDLDGPEPVYIGETRIFQTYLVEAFSDATDDHLVGRIVKGERAYLFDAPQESEIEGCEKAVAQIQ